MNSEFSGLLLEKESEAGGYFACFEIGKKAGSSWEDIRIGLIRGLYQKGHTYERAGRNAYRYDGLRPLGLALV